MKKKWIAILFILFNLSLRAQLLNQDAEGKSSIVVGGSSLNLDIGASLIKANYYKVPDSRGLAWGIDLQGKNKEGMAGLFETGEISPGAELSGLVGWKIIPGNTKLLFYSRFTLHASQFKQDKGNGFTNIPSRFVDTTHYGSKIELGASCRFGNHVLFGLLAGSSGEDNQATLTKSVYKYTMTDPVIPGLQQTRDITAYSGTYGTYRNTYVYMDAMYFHSLGTYYLCPALYLRLNNSNDENLRQSSTVVGGSINFVSVAAGKFMGGLYLQDSDVTNKDALSFKKRIEFGLIARFSFDAIGL